MSCNYYDVVIVGGGAAGLCTSIYIKQNAPWLSVVLLEQLPRVGKKLIVTGNGRCNITNSDESMSRFHSENPTFFEYALNRYNNAVIESFFEKIGVIFTFDETGRAYPYSLQASSVVDALRFAADDFGVEILTDSPVRDIANEDGKFTISVKNAVIKCRCAVIAAGLYSGGEKLGSNGSILKLMCSRGYKSINTSPSIVQLKTKTDIVRQLKGIKVNALAKLLLNGEVLRREYGEVLFCDYGLSGPPVMQLSREVGRKKGKFCISLDLMPEYEFSELFEILKVRLKNLRSRALEEFFTGMLNKRVGQIIIKLCGKKPSDEAVNFSYSELKTLVFLIKNFNFEVIDTAGFINSQATAGGLDTSSFNDKNMMSLSERGLFAAGEILDVDGDCGGFNLHWAWSSAMCAADGVIKYLDGAE